MENTMEKKIRPAPSSFKADVWAHFGKSLIKLLLYASFVKSNILETLQTSGLLQHPKGANEVQPKSKKQSRRPTHSASMLQTFNQL